MNSSEYIEQQRKEYALYVLESRALPSIADGLKKAARRVLWVGKDCNKYKTASLAGATMPIHPHQEPSGVINTLTAPFGNNLPLFTGYGAFGTLLDPQSYGAARYTSVKVSNFTKDVIFADIDLVELIDNYDQTLKEVKHFLPLIPIVLLNPSKGIAVGFATNILPRSLEDIINAQIDCLNDNSVDEVMPEFYPFNSKAIKQVSDNEWEFCGGFRRMNSFEIQITDIPYSTTYEKVVNTLNKTLESGYIKDYDDNSSDKIDIIVKFHRGFLNKTTDDKILKDLGLIGTVKENITILDFDGAKVLDSNNFSDIIIKFTTWRLKYYKKRYERLIKEVISNITRCEDILKAIDGELGKHAPTFANRTEMKRYIVALGITNVDYIADLPLYRYTKAERDKVDNDLNNQLKTKVEMEQIIDSPDMQKELYIKELKGILSNYKKGKYNNI